MNNYPLNPNLKDFWNWRIVDNKLTYEYARNRVLYGGRASSKTHEFAGALAKIASEHKTKALCVRRFQNKIKQSVYTAISDKISSMQLTGYDIQASEIVHKNGSELVFYGIERNTEEVKSFEGADILWIEEAHNLTKEQWEILEPTIRKEGSEVWVSFNPKYVTDFIYQYFIVNTPKNTKIRFINYDENPNLSSTMLDVIEQAKARDYEDFKHIYLGVPLEDSDKVIIKRAWIDAAIDAHIKIEQDNAVNKALNLVMRGAKTLGYDVADEGTDKNAVVKCDGSIIYHCEEWRGDANGLTDSVKRVKLLAQQESSLVIYDSIGVGALTSSKLKDLNYFKCSKFIAGGKVVKPHMMYSGVKQGEYFANLKAQAWWRVADRFRNTYDYIVNGNINYKSDELISIDSTQISSSILEQLKAELSTLYRDFDNAGRVKVESKSDLSKRGINSPNLADAFIMAASISLVVNKSTEINFTGF